MNRGIWSAAGAYFLWGLLPIYWKLLRHVPSLELLSHRVAWSFLTLCVLLWVLRRWRLLWASVQSLRVLGVYALASVLIGANWWLYIWSVNSGYIIETSLGYFINPLLSVVMGVVFFRERLRRGQWIAVGIAAMGVLYLTFVYGAVPWIALTLALSFGFYGAVKKVAPLGPLAGLTLETAMLFLPSLIYLSTLESQGRGAFGHMGWLSTCLLIGAGAMTTAPLLLFAAAAQRIPLSLVGIIQYIAPTMQFLLGVWVYQEPFSLSQLVGFVVIWMALLVFAGESFWFSRMTITARSNNLEPALANKPQGV